MSFWTEFRDTALDGLGVGSGDSAAQTLGNLFQGQPAPPAAGVTQTVTGSSALLGPAGVPVGTLLLIGGGLIAVYLVLRR